jgi:hypothetical protein
MKIISANIIKALTCALFILTLSSIAQAQATRTWVSGLGSDANPCSLTAPCKTFAGAISKTAVHGEISVLDPGGYGTVTITKSITIEGTAGQGYGSILNSFGSGVTINFDSFNAAGETQKTVRLRNLNINGSGGATAANFGLRGVRIVGGAASAGSEVFVEDCVIDGSTVNPGRGIVDERSGGGRLIVTGTTVRNMSGAGIVVVPALNGAARIDATLDNVRVHNCGFGIVASSGARMMVSNSVISNNANHGLGVEGPFGAAEMHVTNCRVASNAAGIRQDAGGTVRVANSDVVFNTANGTVGTVNSYGNNRFAGNAGSSAVVAIGADTHDKGQQ